SFAYSRGAGSNGLHGNGPRGNAVSACLWRSGDICCDRAVKRGASDAFPIILDSLVHHVSRGDVFTPLIYLLIGSRSDGLQRSGAMWAVEQPGAASVMCVCGFDRKRFMTRIDGRAPVIGKGKP